MLGLLHQRDYKYVLSLLLGLVISNIEVEGLIRISCIGDSITKGSGSSSSEYKWVNRVGAALEDEGFEVLNFGVSGRTMMETDKFYQDESEWSEALESGADIFLIGLGTNDAKDKYWDETEDVENVYTSTYLQMIETIRSTVVPQGGNGITVFCLIPILQLEPSGDWPDPNVINEEVPNVIQQMGQANDLPVIDLRPGFEFPDDEEQDDEDFLSANPDLYDDSIHPNDAGHLVISQNVLAALRLYLDITATPTAVPTYEPTYTPSTSRPSFRPSHSPSFVPSPVPTYTPTYCPSPFPTPVPSIIPTSHPTLVPTYMPTPTPTEIPTPHPTWIPTVIPSPQPTKVPTPVPTTSQPTAMPSTSRPTAFIHPTGEPTLSMVPTTSSPTTFQPSTIPPSVVTTTPTFQPTQKPSIESTPQVVSTSPTQRPSIEGTARPESRPTFAPSPRPTSLPTFILDIASALILDNVNADEFEAESAASSAFEFAISEVLSGSRTSVTDISSYSVGSQRRKLLEEGSTATRIDFEVEESISANEDAEDIAEDIMTKLTTAIEDGSLDSALTNAASTQGSTVLTSASISRDDSLDVVSSETKAIIITPAPSPDSHGGDKSSSKSSGSTFSSVSTLLIILIIAVVLVCCFGVLLVSTLLPILLLRSRAKPARKDSFTETEARMELFPTNNARSEPSLSPRTKKKNVETKSDQDINTNINDKETPLVVDTYPSSAAQKTDNMLAKPSAPSADNISDAGSDLSDEQNPNAIKLIPTSERADSPNVEVQLAASRAASDFSRRRSSQISTIELELQSTMSKSTHGVGNNKNPNAPIEIVTPEDKKDVQEPQNSMASSQREIEMALTTNKSEFVDDSLPPSNTADGIEDDGLPSVSKTPSDYGRRKDQNEGTNSQILFLD